MFQWVAMKKYWNSEKNAALHNGGLEGPRYCNLRKHTQIHTSQPNPETSWTQVFPHPGCVAPGNTCVDYLLLICCWTDEDVFWTCLVFLSVLLSCREVSLQGHRTSHLRAHDDVLLCQTNPQRWSWQQQRGWDRWHLFFHLNHFSVHIINKPAVGWGSNDRPLLPWGIQTLVVSVVMVMVQRRGPDQCHITNSLIENRWVTQSGCVVWVTVTDIITSVS